MARLNQFGGWAGDVFKRCNQSVHEPYVGDLHKLVDDAEALCKRLLALR